MLSGCPLPRRPSDIEVARRAAHRRAFGDVIRQAREDRGLTQETLAKRAEVSRPTIARIEGSTNTITLVRSWALAHALEITAKELIARPELLVTRKRDG